MRKYFLIIVLPMILAGCATQLAVKERQEFRTQTAAFVLLKSSPWDARFRSELSQKGFKVLKSSTQLPAITKGKDAGPSHGADVPEAQYGLALSWAIQDHCVENDSKVIDATLVVSDIKTKEVIMVIKKSGFTGPCGTPRTLVFEELVNSLANGLRRR